jgi:hypothetical protein
MKRAMWLAIGLVGICLVLGRSYADDTPTAKVDLQQVKKESELVESVLDQSLTQSFGGPFGYLERVRGAYLPGFGVTFSFEINLTPSSAAGPFGSPPSPQLMRTQEKEVVQRRDAAKTVSENTLADFGHTLQALSPNESVAIVVYTVAARPQGVERGTIVIECKKQLISSLEAKSIDRATFMRELTVVEY